MKILPIDAPDANELRQLREELGLSQSQLSEELGFGKNGPDVVRSWEAGVRNGQPCHPTPLAWRCMRLLVAIRRTFEIGNDLSALVYLRSNLPMRLQ